MFPHLIDLGPLHIATYGVLVAAAYLLGILWLKSERERMRLSEDDFWSLIYSLFFGALAGAKLLFILLNWRSYASGEMGLLRDFRYGFVFYGGCLGMFAAGVLWCRSKKLGRGDYLRLADYFGVAVPLGLWLGRVGCLAAGCCYGRPTALPWGIRFTRPDCLVPPGLQGVALHPAQLYEAVGDIAIAAVLWRTLRAVQAGRLKTGAVIYGYCLLYAALRFSVEFFRGDDRGGALAGLSPSQWIAVGFAATVGALAWRRGFRAGRAA